MILSNLMYLPILVLSMEGHAHNLYNQVTWQHHTQKHSKMIIISLKCKNNFMNHENTVSTFSNKLPTCSKKNVSTMKTKRW